MRWHIGLRAMKTAVAGAVGVHCGEANLTHCGPCSTSALRNHRHPSQTALFVTPPRASPTTIPPLFDHTALFCFKKNVQHRPLVRRRASGWSAQERVPTGILSPWTAKALLGTAARGNPRSPGPGNRGIYGLLAPAGHVCGAKG